MSPGESSRQKSSGTSDIEDTAADSRSEPYTELDHRDEEQIQQEMTGEIVKEFVHTIKIDGRQITHLSIVGTREAGRRRGNIEILDVKTEETTEEIRALVKMRDLENRIDVLGASAADKKKPFAYTLAVNKLIPAKLIATLIEEFLKRQRSLRTESEAPKAPEEQPPAQQETWHVSTSRNLPATEDSPQYPLADKDKIVGQANISRSHQEAAFLPDGKVLYESGPVGFLRSKILEPIKAKHPQFEFEFKVVDGIVEALFVKPLDPEGTRLGELLGPVGWAYSKATEPVKQ